MCTSHLLFSNETALTGAANAFVTLKKNVSTPASNWPMSARHSRAVRENDNEIDSLPLSSKFSSRLVPFCAVWFAGSDCGPTPQPNSVRQRSAPPVVRASARQWRSDAANNSKHTNNNNATNVKRAHGPAAATGKQTQHDGKNRQTRAGAKFRQRCKRTHHWAST